MLKKKSAEISIWRNQSATFISNISGFLAFMTAILIINSVIEP